MPTTHTSEIAKKNKAVCRVFCLEHTKARHNMHALSGPGNAHARISIPTSRLPVACRTTFLGQKPKARAHVHPKLSPCTPQDESSFRGGQVERRRAQQFCQVSISHVEQRVRETRGNVRHYAAELPHLSFVRLGKQDLNCEATQTTKSKKDPCKIDHLILGVSALTLRQAWRDDCFVVG